MAATGSFLRLAPPLVASSSISTPRPKSKQLLASCALLLEAPSSAYPFISFTRRLQTTTKHFGFTRGNTIPPPRTVLLRKNKNTTPRPSAAAAAASDAIPQQTGPDTATSTIISALLFIAFVGLSILTIGIVYIAVTDFLQKREGEKFQKEEAERKKKGGGKKRQMKARAGPKGFGQKIVEIDEAGDDS